MDDPIFWLLRQLPRIFLPRDHYDYLNHYKPGTINLVAFLLLLPFALWVLSFGIMVDLLGSLRSLSDMPFLLTIGLGPVALALLIRLLLHLFWHPEEPESGPNARWYCPICRRRNAPGDTTCTHCGEGFRPLGR